MSDRKNKGEKRYHSPFDGLSAEPPMPVQALIF